MSSPVFIILYSNECSIGVIKPSSGYLKFLLFFIMWSIAKACVPTIGCIALNNYSLNTSLHYFNYVLTGAMSVKGFSSDRCTLFQKLAIRKAIEGFSWFTFSIASIYILMWNTVLLTCRTVAVVFVTHSEVTFFRSYQLMVNSACLLPNIKFLNWDAYYIK